MASKKIRNFDPGGLPGVYKVSCTQCEKCYIGQIGLYLFKGLSEHKSNLTKSNYSAISDHYVNSNHKIDFSQSKLLFVSDNDIKRKIVESLYIKNSNVFDNNTQSLQLQLY